MLTKLLNILHQQPIWSTGILFVIGMVVIFANMVYLSNQMSEQVAEEFAETYIRSLDQFQSEYSSKIVGRLKPMGIEIAHDYLEREGAIPFPATFSIELADALADRETGLRTRLYSDYPFRFRTEGGARDAFEREALTALRTIPDKEQAFIRYEDVDGVWSLRYAKAIVMQQTCVDCHNTHPESTKTDWQVGDVRGVRAVTFPLEQVSATARGGWAVTLAVMLTSAIAGLGLVFLVIQALRASIDMLSTTNTAYNRFVPHEFLSYLQKKSIVDVRLNDNIEKEMAILFSDIRSFTELSERMTPEESFRFVNEYLSIMGPVVRSNSGFIDKYIGDAIMALFDHADDAVRAAVQMLEALRDYNSERRARGDRPINIGIGLHTGLIRLGTIGEHNRMDGTVIGDAVNLAARIEGITKVYGVQCLISEDAYRTLRNQENYAIRRLDKVRVKGKTRPVTIYEVFDGNEPALRDKKRLLRTYFEHIITIYQQGNFKTARDLFTKYLREVSQDRAAKFYIDRCERYIAQPPASDWDGSLYLRSK